MRLCILAILCIATFGHSAEYQLGNYYMEAVGLYGDIRFPIKRFFVGAGASEGFITVATVDKTSFPTGNGYSYFTITTPTNAEAMLHGLEGFVGLDLFRNDLTTLQLASGLGWALLDGTGEGQDGRSRDMWRIPVRMEGIWTPGFVKALPSLGIAVGLGIEWRKGIDKPDLFREISSTAIQGRVGLHI